MAMGGKGGVTVMAVGHIYLTTITRELAGAHSQIHRPQEHTAAATVNECTPEVYKTHNWDPTGNVYERSSTPLPNVKARPSKPSPEATLSDRARR